MIDKKGELLYNFIYIDFTEINKHMENIRTRYRTTMVRIGAALLLWLAMFYGFFLLAELIAMPFEYYASAEIAEVVYSISSSVAYMLAFSLAALLFHVINKQKYDQPIRFTPRLPKNSFVMIFAGIGCCFAFSVINGFIVSLLPISSTEIFTYPSEFSPDRSIVLQFIAIALVPAFCEELLFRGVILSNLMPYGKASAIIISSVLFGLMHGSMNQFVYTTVAGIIMGAVYVYTRSIWCSILMHMINNTLSVLQYAIYDRFADTHDWIIWIIIDCICVTAAIILVFHFSKNAQRKGGTYPCAEDVDSDSENISGTRLTFSSELSVREIAKGFLTPTVLIFVIVSWILSMMTLGVT